MDKIQTLIDTFGINEREARIYLALTDTGPSNVSRIAKAVDLPRTALYTPLESLMKRGLLTMTKIQKRKLYKAIQPKQLKGLFTQKMINLETLVTNLNQKEQIISSKDDVDISYFSGRQGIMTAGSIFLEETKNKIWYSFENPVNLTELVGLNFESQYIQARTKRGIESKMILSVRETTSWLRDFLQKDSEQLRETITISPTQYPFSSTVVATKGMIILINSEQDPFAVIIKNKHLANTLISIHKLSWDRYK